jgi:hypothetical protein
VSLHRYDGPIVQCAKCGHPVERLQWFWSYEDRGWVISAFCHGEEDWMVMREEWVDTGMPDIVAAVAFADPKLLAAAA